MIDINRCRELLKKGFISKSFDINGNDVEVFSYRLSDYQLFKENEAFEMRGITFVHQPGGPFTYKCFPMMQKFFNVNENEDWSLDKLKNKKIVNVQEKSDGSLITFIPLPDGTIKAKTKMGFDNKMCEMAEEIFNKDEKINLAIREMISKNQYAMFELVSPLNQIVLNYEETNLILLNVRDENWKYMSQDYLESFGIPVVKSYDYTLDDLLRMKETETDVEGWVIRFEDDQMAKVKTKWYMDRHGTLTEMHESILIDLTLNEQIDDVLSMVTPGTQKHRYFSEISHKTVVKYNKLLNRYNELMQLFLVDFNGDRKSFSLEYAKKEVLFPCVMKNCFAGKSDEDIIKEHILYVTRRQELARNWLNEN
jgi:T4 RnlA family RNA ligase